MLSNTAVPKYYGEFREQVLAGEIPVCKYIAMEMNRIDALIDNPGVYYDDQAIDGFIAFCENELTLTDGEPVFLLDSFKLWAESLLSWFYYVEKTVYVPGEKGKRGKYERKIVKQRLINKQILIVSRGAAKSLYLSYLQQYGLNIDVSTTHGVTTAPTMKQAEEVIGPMRTAITKSRGPLFQFLTDGSLQNTTGNKANRTKLASTKKGVENFLTNSIVEVRAMSIDKFQGLRPKYVTIDEWLSGDIREDVIGAAEQGASKIDDYMLIAVSSEGTVRNGAGDEIKKEMIDVLQGEYYNPHVSIWYYRLDNVEEVSNPEMWPKAQPNIGKTVSYETYQRDVEKAEKVPAARNDILAKRFGIPMEGYTYFFTYEQTIPHRPRTYWGAPTSLGMDASQGDDFCSFTFGFPMRNGGFGNKTLCFITEKTLFSLPPTMRSKYDEFIAEGSLRVMDGVTLDMGGQVYDEVDTYIEANQYEVLTFGYDPYNSEEFVKRWIAEHGEFGVEKVPQGARTESVPLGEMRKMAENRIYYFDEEIMVFCMGNAIGIEDTNGNIKLSKKRADRKIDCVASSMDSYIAYKRNKEAFD